MALQDSEPELAASSVGEMPVLGKSSESFSGAAAVSSKNGPKVEGDVPFVLDDDEMIPLGEMFQSTHIIGKEAVELAGFALTSGWSFLVNSAELARSRSECVVAHETSQCETPPSAPLASNQSTTPAVSRVETLPFDEDPIVLKDESKVESAENSAPTGEEASSFDENLQAEEEAASPTVATDETQEVDRKAVSTPEGDVPEQGSKTTKNRPSVSWDEEMIPFDEMFQSTRAIGEEAAELMQTTFMSLLTPSSPSRNGPSATSSDSPDSRDTAENSPQRGLKDVEPREESVVPPPVGEPGQAEIANTRDVKDLSSANHAKDLVNKTSGDGSPRGRLQLRKMFVRTKQHSITPIIEEDAVEIVHNDVPDKRKKKPDRKKQPKTVSSPRRVEQQQQQRPKSSPQRVTQTFSNQPIVLLEPRAEGARLKDHHNNRDEDDDGIVMEGFRVTRICSVVPKTELVLLSKKASNTAPVPAEPSAPLEPGNTESESGPSGLLQALAMGLSCAPSLPESQEDHPSADNFPIHQEPLPTQTSSEKDIVEKQKNEQAKKHDKPADSPKRGKSPKRLPSTKSHEQRRQAGSPRRTSLRSGPPNKMSLRQKSPKVDPKLA